METKWNLREKRHPSASQHHKIRLYLSGIVPFFERMHNSEDGRRIGEAMIMTSMVVVMITQTIWIYDACANISFGTIRKRQQFIFIVSNLLCSGWIARCIARVPFGYLKAFRFLILYWHLQHSFSKFFWNLIQFHRVIGHIQAHGKFSHPIGLMEQKIRGCRKTLFVNYFIINPLIVHPIIWFYEHLEDNPPINQFFKRRVWQDKITSINF